MNEDEFQKSIDAINSSFLNTKSLIRAGISDWELFSTEFKDILDKFNSGNPVTLNELKEVQNLWKSKAPLIDERGNPFVLYIKDHRSAKIWGTYKKSHISWCFVLEKMEKGGRFDKYHKKTDIENELFDITYGPNEDDTKKLDVCKVCLDLMRQKSAPEVFPYTVQNFNTKEFFDKYGYQGLKKPTGGIFPVVLPENWDQISRKLREEANWVCAGKCHNSFLNNRGALHVHHKNGVLGDVRRENLIVLCHDCHSKEFAHGHMGSSRDSMRPHKVTSKKGVVSSATPNKSDMNKLENFLQHPEQYATGTEISVQKVKDVRTTFGLIRNNLSEEKQTEFQRALSLFESKQRSQKDVTKKS